MWNPESIIIDNLFAHKHSEYRFKNNRCTVIFGKNNTDRGMQNNGAGKTTLLEGIAIALTNESLRDVKKESFINREEEDCGVDFTLSNPVLKKKLRIVRKFYRGNKPVKIELYENDKLNKQVTSVAEANKRVFELIGISREDLLRYFIISQDNRYTFFTASDGDKKEIMNRITSADMVNPVLEELSMRLKEKEAEYKIVSDEVNELSTRKEILEEQARNVLENDTTAEELEALRESKTEKEAELETERENLSNLEKKAKRKLKELNELKPKVKDKSKLVERRKKLKKEFDETDSDLTEARSTVRQLKAELEEVITCPKCNHEFIKESETELSVKEIRELLTQATLVQSELEETYSTQQSKLKELKKKIDEADEIQESLEEAESEHKRLTKRVSNKKADIEDIETKIESISKEITTLKNRKKDNKILKNIQRQIKEAQKEIDEKLPKVTELTSDIELIRYWQFHMGRSGFQTYLANQSIKIIEGSTNFFLERMNIDYRASISAFTVLKSGEVRGKIDCFITDGNVEARKFWSFSGGERQRVVLAGILAIHRLINLSLNGKGLNLLLLDESLGNIDSEGTIEIVNVLENLGMTILLITQNVEDSSIFENYIEVIKDRGISKFNLST